MTKRLYYSTGGAVNRLSATAPRTLPYIVSADLTPLGALAAILHVLAWTVAIGTDLAVGAMLSRDEEGAVAYFTMAITGSVVSFLLLLAVVLNHVFYPIPPGGLHPGILAVLRCGVYVTTLASLLQLLPGGNLDDDAWSFNATASAATQNRQRLEWRSTHILGLVAKSAIFSFLHTL